MNPRTRRGFTLTEIVLVMGIVVVLVVAANGVLALCMRAVDGGKDSDRNRERAAVLDQLRLDLSEATRIRASAPSDITFDVADRTGDGNAETIRYRWSGAAGAPLQRTENGTETPLVAGVSSFVVNPLVATARGTPVLLSTEERLLVASRESPVTGSLSLTASLLGAAVVASPALPSGTVEWAITRVRVKLSRGALTTGSCTLRLRHVSGGQPTTTDLAASTVLAVNLSQSSSWQDFPFPDTSMGSADSVAIVVSILSAPLVLLDTVATHGDGSTLFLRSVGGWTESSGNLPIFEVYGKAKVLAQGPERLAVPTVLVTIGLDGGDPAIETQIDMPMEPLAP